MPAWCVYSEPRNAKNIAERLQCKVVHGIATGRSYFNRKLLEISENRQKGNSVHSENAQAAAKRKIIPVVHVTCVSLPVCSAEAPARPMPWPRRTQKTSSWRTRACVPGPRLGHTPNGGRNHCLFKTSAAQVWPNLAQGPARDHPRTLAARARPGLLPVVKHLLVHESRLGSFYCHDQGACNA